MRERGVFVYVGTTQVKKSTLAIANAWADVAALGWPLAVLDPGEVWNFKSMVHARTVQGMIDRVWRDRQHTAFTADDLAADEVGEYGRIFGGAFFGRKAVILGDECADYMSGRTIPRMMDKCIRKWAHRKLSIHLTTQRPADLNGVVFSCCSEAYVFQTIADRDHTRLWDEWKILPEDVKDLPVGTYLTVRKGTLVRDGEGKPCRRTVAA